MFDAKEPEQNAIPFDNESYESKINLLGIEFEIIEIPGHTLDHIAYYSENNGCPILFCGDTLFSGGCGRIFEGTPDQMYESLSKLSVLDLSTKIYCTHEYTQSNLNFAIKVELYFNCKI